MSFPGSARAASMTSRTVFQGRSGRTTSTFGDVPTSDTGVNALSVSKGSFACRDGFTAWAKVAMTIVLPSGALLATYWWDFPPEDDAYDFLIVPVYGTIGALVGLFGAALLLALVLLGRGTLSHLRDRKR